MITRSQLDSGREDYLKQFNNEISKLNVVTGRFQILFEEAKKGGGSKRELELAAFKVQEAEKRVERCVGAIQSVDWQIGIIDLENPEAKVKFGGWHEVKDSVRI